MVIPHAMSLARLLQVKLSVVVCDLHMPAIIGTDVVISQLADTLSVKDGRLFTEAGVYLQLHWQDSAHTDTDCVFHVERSAFVYVCTYGL